MFYFLKMAGVIASKSTGFIVWYIILIGVATLMVASSINVEGQYNIRLDNVEDGVVINKVVRCFSEEGNFGVIDPTKFHESSYLEILDKCFGNKYNFDLELKRLEGENVNLEFGEQGTMTEVSRYVLINEADKGNKGARLEVRYNVA